MAAHPFSAIELTLPAALAGTAGRLDRSPSELVVELFDEHAAALLRSIRNSGLDAAAAEDVLQETFVALYQHLVRDRPRTNLPGWLFQVASNLSRREQRRRRRGIRLASWHEAPAARLVAPEPTPADRLEICEAERRVQAAIGDLSARDQRCLRLRAQGLQYRDIAKALGLSLGSVAKSVARALAHLATAAKG
jgi:RNA polymerase sigma-70 factor (ECF subfamily)